MTSITVKNSTELFPNDLCLYCHHPTKMHVSRMEYDANTDTPMANYRCDKYCAHECNINLVQTAYADGYTIYSAVTNQPISFNAPIPNQLNTYVSKSMLKNAAIESSGQYGPQFWKGPNGSIDGSCSICTHKYQDHMFTGSGHNVAITNSKCVNSGCPCEFSIDHNRDTYTFTGVYGTGVWKNAPLPSQFQPNEDKDAIIKDLRAIIGLLRKGNCDPEAPCDLQENGDNGNFICLYHE